jgi:hypothetical protein
MHRLTPIVLSFALAAVTATACGGGGGSPSAREALEEAVDVLCAKAFECRDSFPANDFITFEDVYGATEAACVSRFTTFVDPAGVQASVDAGRIAYSSGDAEACTDFQAGLTCDQVWAENQNPPAACDRAFMGTVADGDACTHELDCAGEDSYCVEDTMTCEPFGL